MSRLIIWISILVTSIPNVVFPQSARPHREAHSHNDYEQPRPLLDALKYGFTSVEADVHWVEGRLLVAHDQPGQNAQTLEKLYLRPLDSLLTAGKGRVYLDSNDPFYLMIDVKTEAVTTYHSIRKALSQFRSLICTKQSCPVKIFISGNRAVSLVLQEGNQGLALDGRPSDLSKGIPSELMPLVSDRYSSWCDWNGSGEPAEHAFDRIRALADKTHQEGKRLRLWAIPDHADAWALLIRAGVDMINTDRLEALHRFLEDQKGSR